MINSNMREYNYFLYGDETAYGQVTLSKQPVGTVKMSITVTNQSVQDNIKYHGATYLGLTQHNVTDKYVIQYGEELLKVLYVTNGRYKQVFLGSYE